MIKSLILVFLLAAAMIPLQSPGSSDPWEGEEIVVSDPVADIVSEPDPDPDPENTEGTVLSVSDENTEGTVLSVSDEPAEQEPPPLEALGTIEPLGFADGVMTLTGVIADQLQAGIDGELAAAGQSGNYALVKTLVLINSNLGNTDSAAIYGLTALEIADFSGYTGTTFPAYLFNGASSLTTVALPTGVPLSGNMFQNCSKLKKLWIGSNTQTDDVIDLTGYTAPAYGANAFQGCSSITAVCLPAGAQLSNSMFLNCSGLKKLWIGSNEPSGNRVDLNGYTAPAYGTNAFQGCTSITGVRLAGGTPGPLMSASMFQGCISLDFVIFQASTAPGFSGALQTDGISPLPIAYYPAGGTGYDMTWTGGRFRAVEPLGMPAFGTHPQSVNAPVYGPASFTVAATGVPAPTLQWQVSADSGVTWTDISGATGLTYTVATVNSSDNGKRYRCVATNIAGSVQSNVAVLNVGYAATLTVSLDDAPYTGHGKSFTLRQGGNIISSGTGINDTVSFTNVINGTYNVYDGTGTAGSPTGVDTGVTLTIAGANGSAALDYYTVTYSISNAGTASGSTLSAIYGVASVLPNTTSGGSLILHANRALTFTATGAPAISTNSFEYSWSVSPGTSGQTENQITISELTSATTVSCEVTGTTRVTPVLLTGLTAPVALQTPVAAVSATAEFTSAVTWEPEIPAGGTFRYATVYTASITLTAAAGYTFNGVPANSFNVAGGLPASNPAGTGTTLVVTVVCPETQPEPVSIFGLKGITPPVTFGTPVSAIIDNDQYTGTVSWSPAPIGAGGTFLYMTAYTANISLTAKPGYTFAGIAANAFSVDGATSVNSAAGSGTTLSVSAAFPQTRLIDIDNFAIDGVAAFAYGMPVSSVTETDQYTGTVAWAPSPGGVGGMFEFGEVYIATITIAPKPGYTLANADANSFYVKGATSATHSAGVGVISATFVSVDLADDGTHTEYKTWKGSGDVIFTLDKPSVGFKHLVYGKKTVSGTSYDVYDGSTVIVVHKEYLKALKLKNGQYKFNALYNEDYATLVLTVDIKGQTGGVSGGTGGMGEGGTEARSSTGDNFSIVGWLIVFEISEWLLIFILILNRKRLFGSQRTGVRNYYRGAV